MAIVMNREQRDAVYRFVVSDLAEVGNLAVALEEDEIVRAQQLRRHFDQGVQLLDQIEWEKAGTRDRYEVALAAADALGIFGRLHESATRVINDGISEFANVMLKEAFCVTEVAGAVVGEDDPLPSQPQLRSVDGELGSATDGIGSRSASTSSGT
jgi:hypothetical protein